MTRNHRLGEPALFFERGATAPDSRGRLLLLSYHFPPSRAVGALRWQKFVGHAAERGWLVDVITLDPQCIEQHDADRLQDLPVGVRVFGVPAAPNRVHRVVTALLKARRAVMDGVSRFTKRGGSDAASSVVAAVPRQDSLSWSEIRSFPLSLRELGRDYTAWLDYASMGAWARTSADLATVLARETGYSAVITCGPPHMVHEAGRIVAERTGLPLVMDFRDPWSLVERVPEVIASLRWRRKAIHFERGAMNRASLVVVNTEPHCRALRLAYPTLKAPIIAVTNGYDDDDLPQPRRTRRFVIAYAGAIYLDRDPRPVFRAAARVVSELKLTPADLAIAFMGSGSFGGVSLQAMAEAEGIAAFVEVRPAGPRREALEFLADATMLVSLPQDSDMAIPSKIFEYMQYHAWLLALAAPESATALLLEGSPANVVRRDDVESLYRVLRERYEQHVRGVMPPRIADDQRFSRRRQAEILFDALENVLELDLGTPVQTPRSSAPVV